MALKQSSIGAVSVLKILRKYRKDLMKAFTKICLQNGFDAEEI